MFVFGFASTKPEARLTSATHPHKLAAASPVGAAGAARQALELPCGTSIGAAAICCILFCIERAFSLIEEITAVSSHFVDAARPPYAMGRIRRTKNLSCFYCGKQTGLKFDGTITNFLCLSCDATNYLDENGDITDPPVATGREAAPSQYAKPQPAAAVEPDVVFCEKCVKNQRLFTASLAQYLPDDPDHPDYEELDRNYYRYRRNLEKRYPQVCDECADTVQERIRQAGYTAKTDHLRRMMDKSRGRKATRRTSMLDVASSLGGWLWRGGLAAQLLWHLVHITQALEYSDNGMYDPDDASIYAKSVAATKTALAWLPDEDALMRLSITTAIVSAWWNPHFVQFTRGFTRHLLGFTRWYSFQGLIIFFRVLFRSVLSMQGGAARSQSAQLSVHLATAGITCLIYIMASRSIKVDTTPLFRPEDKPLTPRRKMIPAKRKAEDSKTFSELFNEALDSTPQKGGIASMTGTPGTPNYASGSAFVPPSQMKMMQQQHGFNDSPLATAPVFKPLSQPQHADYGDEMDWSPSQPQHRAFRSSPERKETARPFGQSPTQSDGVNPFWFKVPAAPVNPARQLRNPPNMPVLRKKPVEQDDVFFTSRRDSAEYKRGGFLSIFCEARGCEQHTENRTTSPRRAYHAVGFAPALGLVLVAAGIIALSGTQEMDDGRDERPPPPKLAEAVLSALGVVELAGVCWVGWETWTGRVDVSMYGAGILAVMLGHYATRLFQD
ncbi:hypothetical protein PWT90_06721 [Aphanocladium album]|nr:hypothetical protein PWT90_06721 [Aphanocladium album]